VTPFTVKVGRSIFFVCRYTRGDLMRRSLPYVLCALAVSCGEPPPPAPSAVINASPKAVCAGDGFATAIHLDAKQSLPYLTLVYVRPAPGSPPLKYTWSFEGSGSTLDEGSLDADALVVHMAGDRPLHVRLRVENSVGGVSDALTSIAVTPLDESGACPLPPAE
jgi:hypothetical protein